MELLRCGGKATRSQDSNLTNFSSNDTFMQAHQIFMNSLWTSFSFRLVKVNNNIYMYIISAKDEEMLSLFDCNIIPFVSTVLSSIK